MNFFTFFKQRTILFIPVKFSILVRYTGGNGGKKIVEEITKKCIGAGCSSTRPYISTSRPNNNNTSRTQNDTFTETPTTTNNSPDTNQTSQEDVSSNNNNQSLIRPMKPLAEQVVKHNNNNDSILEKFSTVPSNYENNNIKEALNAPLIPVDKNISAKETDTANFMDSSNIVDDFVGIPAAPPVFPKPNIAPILDNDSKTFKEQLEEAYKKRQKRIANLQQLEKTGLLKVQDNEEKLTPEFYALLKKKPENYVQMPSNIIEINNIVFNVGILQVTAVDETELLLGIQTHVAVCIYTDQNNSKIVIGFLTSDKKSTVKLSQQQPFNFDKTNNKEQRFALLERPLLVLKEEHLYDLLPSQLKDGSIVDQQKIGQDYVNNGEVYNILQQLIKNKIQEDKILLENYQGKGITVEDIDAVLLKKEFENEKLVKTFFKEYIKLKNQQKNLEKWLDNVQKVNSKVYEKLQKLIDEYENK